MFANEASMRLIASSSHFIAAVNTFLESVRRTTGSRSPDTSPRPFIAAGQLTNVPRNSTPVFPVLAFHTLVN